MLKMFHKHKWQVVAFDTGYCSTYADRPDLGKVYHQVSFQQCRCGERRMVIELDGSGQGSASRHKALNQAKHLWAVVGELQLSNEADVYDPDYQMISNPQQDVRVWRYKPVTEIDKILNMLRNTEEWKNLSKHQMVDDALGELETAIKLHEGIDKA
jgi:hypothetical protein